MRFTEESGEGQQGSQSQESEGTLHIHAVQGGLPLMGYEAKKTHIRFVVQNASAQETGDKSMFTPAISGAGAHAKSFSTRTITSLVRDFDSQTDAEPVHPWRLRMA